MRRLTGIPIIGLLICLTGCGSAERTQDAHNLDLLKKQPEARQWVKSNGQLAPLASNRFESKAEALAFIDSLYAAGVKHIAVCNITDNETEKTNGGPYADALVVLLPNIPAQRMEILAIANQEMRREGFETIPDKHQKTLYLWWD